MAGANFVGELVLKLAYEIADEIVFPVNQFLFINNVDWNTSQRETII